MSNNSGECNIKVICRVRPLNESEQKAGSKFILKFLTDEALSIGGRNFTFDYVFKPEISQEEVYNKIAKPIVKDVLTGYNGTIFAYGQTASGKTHTMEGNINTIEMKGIIPRIIGDIFNHIYTMDEAVEFHIKVSYFEIYMDKIRDLLDVSQTNLSVHEDKNRIPYVKGVTERFVASPEEVMQVIEEGKSNRHVAVTNMNEHSSRSHSVFLINVKQVNTETEKKLSGKLYLVDLAGSEKVSKTGAEGSVLDEAKNINKSLSALGNVIASLADNSNFVPYRDSKLTRILQESLGGNSQTTMVICCSPASYNETETKSTLMFGSRAKTIKNTISVNEELTADEWKRRYKKEKEKNNKLQIIINNYLNELIKWRKGESVPESDRFVSIENIPTSSFSSSSSSSSVSLETLIKQVGVSNSPSGPSETERARWDEEKNNIYKQIDDKDEELNNATEIIEKYKEQINEFEEQIKNLIIERDNYNNDIIRLQNEKEASNTEIKEVFQALSELAQNYDQKLIESDKRKEEIDSLNDEMEKKKVYLKLLESEIQLLKEQNNNNKKKLNEAISLTLQEITEFGIVFGNEVEKEIKNLILNEQNINIIPVAFSKYKSEAKFLIDNNNKSQILLKEENNKNDNLNNIIKNNSTQIQQLESKIKSLIDSIENLEIEKKKSFEENDLLKGQCSELQAKEQIYISEIKDLACEKENELVSTSQIKQTLQQQIQINREQYTNQISDLRSHVSQKDKKVHDLSQQLEETKINIENITKENKELIKTKLELNEALKNLNNKIIKEKQSRNDLESLENSIFKELQLLYTLRSQFVKNLGEKIKQANLKEDEDKDFDPRTQKQKIFFLETNLDQLTIVHKQLVHDNTQLRCELPKLEKRLEVTMKRARFLEETLKESKEIAMRDKKKYQQEVDRVKEIVRQKNLLRKGQSATIVKPIRAGHAPNHNKY